MLQECFLKVLYKNNNNTNIACFKTGVKVSETENTEKYEVDMCQILPALFKFAISFMHVALNVGWALFALKFFLNHFIFV